MMLCALYLLASSAMPATGDAQVPARYAAVMNAQYTAQAAPVPQRPEEAQKIYDGYLKSIGEKSSVNTSGDAGTEPH